MDGRLLTVEVLEKAVNSVSVQDGKGIVHVVLPDVRFAGRRFYCFLFEDLHVEISNNCRNRCSPLLHLLSVRKLIHYSESM